MIDPSPATPLQTPRWNGAAPLLWKLQGDLLAATPRATPPDEQEMDAFRTRLDEAAHALAGLVRYQDAAFRRSQPRLPVAWQRGAVRLLDYGGSGPPVLLVPSMINRGWVLDLTPETSRARWLARNGFRVLLMDWGEPGLAERGYGLAGYIEQRALPALDAANRACGQPPVLIGYCMGGILAFAMAALARERVRGLVTLSAPWDFTRMPEARAFRRNETQMRDGLHAMGAAFGAIPPLAVQAFFSMRDLPASVRKYRVFGEGGMQGAAEETFIAVEDWLNVGAPVATGVALDCFQDWFVANAPAEGNWRIGTARIDAAAFDVPALVATGSRDRVVRPECSAPLAEALPCARLLSAPTGHLGTVIGHTADSAFWPEIAAFLRDPR